MRRSRNADGADLYVASGHGVAKRSVRALLPAMVVACALAGPAQASPDTSSASPADWCRDPRPAAFATLERVRTAQEWFEVYRIRPGVFAIYEPRQFEQVISYLILGERQALLFDSGLGVGHIAAVARELTTLPVSVLNSHTHFDHVGGNADFEEVWNADTAFSRASALAQLDDYARATLEPDHLCGDLPEDVAPGAYTLRPWRVTRRIGDGERIDLGGRVLEIMFTPGHTPDSLVLLDRAHGLLFTGDTYYPGPIYLFAPGTDFAAYEASVARLAKLAKEIELLLPAHSVPVADPTQLVALERAVEQVRSGAVKPSLTDGQLEYSFEGFSLLLAPD